MELSSLIESILPFTEIISTIVLIITLWIMFKEFQRSNKVRRQDMYTNLELSSIDLFKMVIEHPELKKIYNIKINKKLSDTENKQLSEYTASLLNLFEIHFNLRLSGDIDPIIFATWMPWLYELCRSEYFKKIWMDLQKHYVPRFRNFINSLIEVTENTKEPLKEKVFYERASQLMDNDPIIKNWLTS